jgi:exonuclease SbcD
MGDYPAIPDSSNPYAEGIAAFYESAYQYAASQKQGGQAIIALGHLHAQQAEISDTDRMERVIMGGLECISASSFHQDISYVALGHIHKAQRLGGQEHIRYCGSPLPMSFSEDKYKHQVITFDLNGESIQNIRPIEIPVSVPLMRVPSVHSSLPDVLDAILQLEEVEGDPNTYPYLEVRVLLDGPEPGLRHKIETALAGKNLRLAKIDVRYPKSASEETDHKTADPEQLLNLQPIDVLQKVYQNKYNTPIPEELIKLFQQVTQEVSETEA